MSLAYRGLTVLDVLRRTADEAPADAFTLAKLRLDSGGGRLAELALEADPRIGRSVDWYLASRADIAAFRAFRDALQGRVTAFWLPTWDADLLLAEPASAAQSSLVIQACGYAATAMGGSFARRHLAAITGAGAIASCRQVVTAVDNGDGTETLTLNGTLDADLDPASALLSFLLYGRLEADAVTLLNYSPTLAIGTLPFLEIPAECPGDA